MRYPTRPQTLPELLPFDRTHGLDASAGFISAAGTLFPIEPWGRSSLQLPVKPPSFPPHLQGS